MAAKITYQEDCFYATGSPSIPMTPVIDNHGFCAAPTLVVRPMGGAHMHSQVELNLLLSGSMELWFDNERLVIEAGELILFWGMLPHQVTACSDDAQFVVIHAPMALFLNLSRSSALRAALFAGELVRANRLLGYEVGQFLQWREDILSPGGTTQKTIEEEVSARIRRIENDGWTRLSAAEARSDVPKLGGHERLQAVESMTRFIFENGHTEISADDVAKSVGYHPNYAMAVFKRSVGVSIKKAILRHRLDTARALLLNTDRAISDVAFNSGFGSLSSFYASFAKRFNISPVAFRSQVRGAVAT
ncbi:helix-turn-helix domain-containing protein [Devosia faecipullorum]|uniref:helix-turn-helix domain-containing protein n=1 Tax=Devosia faecipullorum TaxID=2755039 RepID=UPI00187B6F29|nr:helix-turn-helix domain-containing protein [Devosia faecipullorum]MBE7734546.1 helix-turn-helix domain-containing protein [Devosia faecipullorum]